ncbi:MAG: choice-of-anchor P family protein [Candidatus Acidiferrales bacterium]
MPTPFRIFLYNAHGYGFSGRIDRPFQQMIDVQAMGSLPLTGGHGYARVENFNLKDIASFKAAYTQVSGSQNPKDGSYTTFVSATLEGLNVHNIVTADRVVARISSNHPADGSEPTITPVGSQFENLRIAGCPVEVELDNFLFNRLGTYSAFKGEYERDEQVRQAMQERFLWGRFKSDVPDFLRERYNWVAGDALPESKGIVLCTLVKDIKFNCPEVRRFGNVLIVPHFGKIYLAEFVVQSYQRTVTMLRLDMGSGTNAMMTGPGAGGNGVGYP